MADHAIRPMRDGDVPTVADWIFGEWGSDAVPPAVDAVVADVRRGVGASGIPRYLVAEGPEGLAWRSSGGTASR